MDDETEFASLSDIRKAARHDSERFGIEFVKVVFKSLFFPQVASVRVPGRNENSE